MTALRQVDDPLPSREVLGMRVDATDYEDAARRILGWAAAGGHRYVCVANVNNAVEAHDDPSYAAVMARAHLVTPDGVPLVWLLRRLGVPAASRVYGPDLTRVLCARAAEQGVPVGFLGGSPTALAALLSRLRSDLPDLQVAYAWSPPYRALRQDEEERLRAEVTASGAHVLFVGLGAPKQERWMADHVAALPVVLVGVGAAFDFLSGQKAQAPSVLQRAGLEWLFRLLHEPRRLWRRYLLRNPRFVALVLLELARRPRVH